MNALLTDDAIANRQYRVALASSALGEVLADAPCGRAVMDDPDADAAFMALIRAANAYEAHGLNADQERTRRAAFYAAVDAFDTAKRALTAALAA